MVKKSTDDILLLGNRLLKQKSMPISLNETSLIHQIVGELHDVLFDFKNKYNSGRAIAAPQLGYLKRIIYMYIDKPVVFINPELSDFSLEMIEIWDDCMSFPNLFVKVQRHKTCSITYYDMDWNKQYLWLHDERSELLQHEFDHLEGVLAVDRAINKNSYKFKRPHIVSFHAL